MQLFTENIYRDYGDGETVVHALLPTTLTFQPGEQAAIIGASGSGKSTLLNLLGGLDTPTGGMVRYGEENLYQMKADDLARFRRRHIGFVFQAYNLIPELTAEENTLVPLLLDGQKKEEPFFTEVTEALGLQNRMTHYPDALSGGQQQRVAIARALIHHPDVLLCDEPTGNLDSKNSQEVMDYLFTLSEKWSITLLVVTHDAKIAQRFPRILHIEDGQVGGDLS
ncbi:MULTISPECIES: ABC transporter ATP-binding protein [Caproicibacterium]|uniref:ABC transporter ATP-binding protein n=1 Tax=Caproicibacterium argilliputei TaxID=3030016 RepID=A0AA97H3M6_9FIRM|nr:ABC transporter ATP-binding protein [Caproicibacterium argilliputei]WOC33377.1 ABC transporter ATP-binding protein [Caproicibacterium argilliputei]